ncbi:MAG: hypothetical protein IPL67_10595 [Ignavibacteria bacterium]|nr:hypothetical protein [Ignavibacteria bacterium]
MFMYAKDKLKSQWEKRIIKERFFAKSRILKKDGTEIYLPYRLDEQLSRRCLSEPLHYKSGSQLLVKDLLGLSSLESWQSYNAKIEKRQAINNNGKWDIQEDEKSTFQRFASPITFKPYVLSDKFRVYILLDQESLNEAININKDFMITNGKNSFHISFPNSFSLDDFFNYFLDSKNIAISGHVDKSFQDHRNYKIFKIFFDQMRKNKNDLPALTIGPIFKTLKSVEEYALYGAQATYSSYSDERACNKNQRLGYKIIFPVLLYFIILKTVQKSNLIH